MHLKYSELELLDIELAIASTAMDVYEEKGDSKGHGGLFGALETLSHDIAYVIDKMIEFAKKLATDVIIMGSKPVMKTKLSRLRKSMNPSMKVQLPDFEAVGAMYKKASTSFPKELKGMLREAKRISSPEALEVFFEHQSDFENRLKKFEDDVDNIIKHPKTYPSDMAYHELERLLNKNNPYINCYYKVIHELEYFKAEYHTMIKAAIRNTKGYNVQAMKVHKNIIARTAASLTKTLKKIIFVIGSMVII